MMVSCCVKDKNQHDIRIVKTQMERLLRSSVILDLLFLDSHSLS
jgi:hypothetical protein